MHRYGLYLGDRLGASEQHQTHSEHLKGTTMQLKFTPLTEQQKAPNVSVHIIIYESAGHVCRIWIQLEGPICRYSPFLIAAKIALKAAGYSVSDIQQDKAIEILMEMSCDAADNLEKELTEQAELEGFAVSTSRVKGLK